MDSPTNSKGILQQVTNSIRLDLNSEQYTLDHPVDSEIQCEVDVQPPNGGYSWVVAIACMIAMFATWGASAGFGVFLDFYIQNEVFPGSNKIDYAFIGGVGVFLAQVLAPLSTFLCRVMNPQWVMAAGVVIQTIGYILASISTKFWQIFMTQGVMFGVSCLLIFIPSSIVLASWFTTKKATAMGVAMSGAGLGGVVFSLSAGAMIRLTGDQRWALRMMCVVALVCVLFAMIVLKPFNSQRKPLSETMTKEFVIKTVGQSLDLRPFYKSYELALLASWFSFCQLGYVLVLFTVAPYALSVGLTPSQVLNVNAILNAALCVGRNLIGFSGDKIGRFNAATGLTFLILVVLFGFWINATTYAEMIGFSVVIGLMSGVAATMTLSLGADLLEGQSEYKLDVVWGGLNVITSPGCLFASVISLGLTNDNVPKPYLHSQIFGGSIFAYCFLTMMVLREAAVRKSLKREIAELTKVDGKHNQELVRLERVSQKTVRQFFARMFYLKKV